MDMTALSTKAVTSSLGTSAKLTTVPVSDSALCYIGEMQDTVNSTQVDICEIYSQHVADVRITMIQNKAIFY